MSLAFQPIKSTTHPFLQVEIHYDPEPQQPDLVCTITYNSRSRYVRGTKAADADRDAEIARLVRDGEYFGMPVWAYVHGGSTIRAAYENPFSCPWDSGRSGWVYMTSPEVRKFFGVKRITKKIREAANAYMRSAVEEFNAYLNSECYGFVIRNTDTDEETDSCWGYYGDTHVREAAMSALKQMESITPCHLALPLTNEGEQV